MSAIISPCGSYRYTLHRSIPQPLRWVKRILFVMLNPSTADAHIDDATIRKCKGFASRHGYTHLTVVNLFAVRSRHPIALLGATDPVGPENDRHIQEQVEIHRNGLIIAAWGSHKPKALEQLILDRAAAVMPMLGPHTYCIGLAKSGAPRHPLMQSYEREFIPFNSGVA